ncbi:MAG: leucine-rich repeat domain-containing protein [Lachnospiraceae bacterium]|nr:leucine-rich repeat domain-containing protein [Lachnospiraceae bacterium]
MGKKIRRLIAVLLCITSVMIMCMPPVSPYASVQKGDFEIDGSTLIKYTGHTDVLTLPNSIHVIGKDAFSGNKSLVKVIMPDSVWEIDFAAFEDCTNLIQVVLPESLLSIGSSAFSGCEQLKYVNIPSKCEEIGSGAFARCPKLSTISVSKANPNFTCLDGVLYTSDGSKLIQYLAGRTRSSFDMPTSVNEIGEYAFWGAGQLKDISFSAQLKEIPEYAFSNCSALERVILPYRVESLMAFSFADCYSLREVIMPDSLGYIDKNAFYLSDNVSIDYYDAARTARKVTDAGLPDEMFVNYIDTVSGNTAKAADNTDGADTKPGLTVSGTKGTGNANKDFSENKVKGELASGKVVGGSAVLMMNTDLPVYGADFHAAEVEDSVPEAIPVPEVVYTEGNYRMVGNKLTGASSVSGNIAIPADVSSIGNRAFYKEKGLEGVSLPSGLEDIGDFAFARTKLNSVNIPDGVKEIGYAAFYNCKDLKDVSIPSSVESIELGAFDGTPWYDQASGKDSNGFLTAGDGILLKYEGPGGSVIVPEGVKTIGAGCFAENDKINDISLPEGLVKIGEEAFRGCKGIKSVSIPETVEVIEDRAFKDTGIGDVTIPASVKSIGLGAFDTGGSGKKIRFMGDEIPLSSYKNTATRLSAGGLRTPPLKGYDTAIIGNETSPKYFSVLSGKKMYKGKIFRLNGEEVKDIPGAEEDTVPESADNRKGNVTVFMDSSISPDKETPIANMSGDLGGYHIKISDALDKKDISDQALASRYGSLDGIEAVPLNISMYEDTTDVPISRLSGRTVDIEMPIPTALTLAPSINVAAVDDNGELKEIASEIVTGGNSDKIRFVARHFSVYVFYTMQEEISVLEVDNEELLAANSQNIVVRTLNSNVGNIAVKWYVGIILLAIAAALVLYRGKPRTLAN